MIVPDKVIINRGNITIMKAFGNFFVSELVLEKLYLSLSDVSLTDSNRP